MPRNLVTIAMSTHPYLRGFVLSRSGSSPPDHFVPGPIFENFFVDPACAIDSASKGGTAVVVLGTCVNVEPEARPPTWIDRLLRRPSSDRAPVRQSPAQHMLDALLKGEKHFFDVLDSYCGRHVVLFRADGGLRILTDATGMRTVFYAEEGGIVASHARLVEDMLGGEIRRSKLPFGYGFPGNRTPYARTRLLTPNTLYDFAQARVVRFWPRGNIAPHTAAEAADKVLEYTSNALKRIAQSNRLSLSVTAGMDSRTTLALAVHSGVPFDAYTYERGPKTAIDCAVAGELTRIAGVSHHIVHEETEIPEDIQKWLNRTTYYSHHHSVLAPMRRHFAERPSLAITANLLEIGRFFYKNPNYESIAPPETAEAMCELYLAALSPQARGVVEKYGTESFKAQATECFDEFLRVSNFNQARGILNSRDQFYWEHRMSAWHAMILLERDFYADCFIPFNSRRVFETLLGVPEKNRKSSRAFQLMIKKAAPQLLSGIPINPREWPVSKPAVES